VGGGSERGREIINKFIVVRTDNDNVISVNFNLDYQLRFIYSTISTKLNYWFSFPTTTTTQHSPDPAASHPQIKCVLEVLLWLYLIRRMSANWMSILKLDVDLIETSL